MAFGTDFHVDIFLGGTGLKGIAAVAGNCSFVILGMDSFLHLLSPLPLASLYHFTRADAAELSTVRTTA